MWSATGPSKVQDCHGRSSKETRVKKEAQLQANENICKKENQEKKIRFLTQTFINVFSPNRSKG